MTSVRCSTRRMRCLGVLLAFLLTACGGGGHVDVALVFHSDLSGTDRVPTVATLANGTGLVTVDADRSHLTATVVNSDIAITGAELRLITPGFTDDLVLILSLEPGTPVWSARAPLDAGQLEQLRAGYFYFNVQSALHPNGEIRGGLIEQLPSSAQWAHFDPWRQQSALVALQFEQISQLEDGHEWPSSGVSIGIGLGF